MSSFFTSSLPFFSSLFFSSVVFSSDTLSSFSFSSTSVTTISLVATLPNLSLTYIIYVPLFSTVNLLFDVQFSLSREYASLLNPTLSSVAVTIIFLPCCSILIVGAVSSTTRHFSIPSAVKFSSAYSLE